MRGTPNHFNSTLHDPSKICISLLQIWQMWFPVTCISSKNTVSVWKVSLRSVLFHIFYWIARPKALSSILEANLQLCIQTVLSLGTSCFPFLVIYLHTRGLTFTSKVFYTVCHLAAPLQQLRDIRHLQGPFATVGEGWETVSLIEWLDSSAIYI